MDWPSALFGSVLTISLTILAVCWLAYRACMRFVDRVAEEAKR